METTYADAFLTITRVQVNFNSNASLLANMAQQQLYEASVARGLKK